MKVDAVVGAGLDGRLDGACFLTVYIDVPARGYSAAVILTGGRSLLAHETVRLRGGRTRLFLSLDKLARQRLTRQLAVSADLRVRLTSPQGHSGLATRQLVLRPRTVRVIFGYIGGEQAFTVPQGVTSVGVVAVGADGGFYETGPQMAGRGAIVSGHLSVHPGETLYVEVGGQSKAPYQLKGGYNGGGNAGSNPSFECSSMGCAGPALGGGGASDVRTISSRYPQSLESRLLVAAGGGGTDGGAGGNAGQPGGSAAGGGSAGRPGTSTGGGAGGAGGSGSPYGKPGASGALGQGGSGGDGSGPDSGLLTPACGQGKFGGGGGGGLFGGGGGGGGGCNGPAAPGGGGAGGSSLVPWGGTFKVDPSYYNPPSITITYALSASAD